MYKNISFFLNNQTARYILLYDKNVLKRSIIIKYDQTGM